MLSTITIPILILVGEHDALTPPYVARVMKERIRNAELHVLPHAAHMSNLENAEEFNKHMHAFLSKIKG
jgi:pimeloyl-ACP methyl ester carboxylesterase